MLVARSQAWQVQALPVAWLAWALPDQAWPEPELQGPALLGRAWQAQVLRDLARQARAWPGRALARQARAWPGRALGDRQEPGSRVRASPEQGLPADRSASRVRGPRRQ